METLTHAIAVAGGVGKLADALGLKANVVSNWIYRNRVPKSWQMVLCHKYAKRKPKTIVGA